MMSSVYDKYEPVVGLEVHVQLQTLTKAFSSDVNEFGSLPNTNVSVITLGHPGTLPKMNAKTIEFAVKLGLACNCKITEFNGFARKNYFYADLPKGYQITQDKTPICTEGHITIKLPNNVSKDIALTRIHMEEDAGKSIHDQDPFDTLIDLNRAGVPLVEIVTEPVICSSEEAYHYLSEVRKIVRYLDICDGNMEEGSLRCDANVSVRLKGDKKFGKRVEVKNMNSMRNVQRAIDYEIKRQIDIIEAGGEIDQNTRSFDAVKGSTFNLRSKEMANDYRYFPEPDLQPVIIKQDYIEKVKSEMPPLPGYLFEKFKASGLSDYDSEILTESKSIALYFNELIEKTTNFKSSANWIMGPIKSYLNEYAIEIEEFPIEPFKIAELIELIDSGTVSYTAATQTIFPLLIKSPEKVVLKIAEETNLIQNSDEDMLLIFAKQAIEKYPEKVVEYKNGKKGLLGLFMGEVMKLSQGKADPKIASSLIIKLLE